MSSPYEVRNCVGDQIAGPFNTLKQVARYAGVTASMTIPLTEKERGFNEGCRIEKWALTTLQKHYSLICMASI